MANKMPTKEDGKQATRGVKVDLGKLGVGPEAKQAKAGSSMVVNLGDLATATALKK